MHSNTAILNTYNAVQSLAGVCDGARKRDAVGFNGRDSEFGKSIASKPFQFWTPKMYATAWKMLRTYSRTQLPVFGIVYDDLLPRLPQPGCFYAVGPVTATGTLARSLADVTDVYVLWYGREAVMKSKDFAELAERAIRYNAILEDKVDEPKIVEAFDEALRAAERANERVLAGEDYYDPEADEDTRRCWDTYAAQPGSRLNDRDDSASLDLDHDLAAREAAREDALARALEGGGPGCCIVTNGRECGAQTYCGDDTCPAHGGHAKPNCFKCEDTGYIEAWGPNEGCKEYMSEPERIGCDCAAGKRWAAALWSGQDTTTMRECRDCGIPTANKSGLCDDCGRGRRVREPKVRQTFDW